MDTPIAERRPAREPMPARIRHTVTRKSVLSEDCETGEKESECQPES